MGDGATFLNILNFWRVREAGMVAGAAIGRLPAYRLTDS